MTYLTATAPARAEGDPGHLVRERLRYTGGMTEMTTIKVSTQTRDRLKRLADEDHLTMDAALSQVLDQAGEARFWAGVRADYARLQADPAEWADYVGELAEWDATVSDGLAGE
jgi:hypothetical protein